MDLTCHRRQGGGSRRFFCFLLFLFCFDPGALGFIFSSRSMKKLPAVLLGSGFCGTSFFAATGFSFGKGGPLKLPGGIKSARKRASPALKKTTPLSRQCCTCTVRRTADRSIRLPMRWARLCLEGKMTREYPVGFMPLAYTWGYAFWRTQ